MHREGVVPRRAWPRGQAVPPDPAGTQASSSSSLLLSSLELSDTPIYEPQAGAPLGTASHFCEVVVLRSLLALLVIFPKHTGYDAEGK